MISLEKKKKIGILTMLLFSASMVFTFIDALVAVNFPSSMPSRAYRRFSRTSYRRTNLVED